MAGVSSAALLAYLGVEVRGGTVFGFDTELLGWFGARAGDEQLSDAMNVLISIGGEHWDPLPFLLIGAIAAGLLAAGRLRDAVLLVVLVAAALVAVDVLQPRFEREPLREGEDLFPSGHATGSAVVFGALAAATWPTRWRWPLLAGGAVFVAAFGASLVFFRAHYPSDVLGGWCLGVLLFVCVYGVISNAPRIHGWMRQK